MDSEFFEGVEMSADKYLAWCEELGETIEGAMELENIGPWPENIAVKYVQKKEYESAEGLADGPDGIVVCVCHSEDTETICRYEVRVEISVEYRTRII